MENKVLDNIITNHNDKSELILILQEAQKELGYLSEETQTYIAKKLEMPVSDINGVVTFYSLFSSQPQGENTISICMGTACYVKGAGTLLETVKEELQVDDGDTTKDKRFTLKSSRCVGACGLAPVLSINDEIYGRVNKDELKQILAKDWSKL